MHKLQNWPDSELWFLGYYPEVSSSEQTFRKLRQTLVEDPFESEIQRHNGDSERFQRSEKGSCCRNCDKLSPWEAMRHQCLNIRKLPSTGKLARFEVLWQWSTRIPYVVWRLCIMHILFTTKCHYQIQCFLCEWGSKAKAHILLDKPIFTQIFKEMLQEKFVISKQFFKTSNNN